MGFCLGFGFGFLAFQFVNHKWSFTALLSLKHHRLRFTFKQPNKWGCNSPSNLLQGKTLARSQTFAPWRNPRSKPQAQQCIVFIPLSSSKWHSVFQLVFWGLAFFFFFWSCKQGKTGSSSAIANAISSWCSCLREMERSLPTVGIQTQALSRGTLVTQHGTPCLAGKEHVQSCRGFPKLLPHCTVLASSHFNCPQTAAWRRYVQI